MDDYVETDSLSNVWRMLQASRDNERDFNVSQIGYNIFKDEKFSWLKHDDIDLEMIEQTNAKCEKWLKDIKKDKGKDKDKDNYKDKVKDKDKEK